MIWWIAYFAIWKRVSGPDKSFFEGMMEIAVGASCGFFPFSLIPVLWTMAATLVVASVISALSFLLGKAFAESKWIKWLAFVASTKSYRERIRHHPWLLEARLERETRKHEKGAST